MATGHSILGTLAVILSLVVTCALVCLKFSMLNRQTDEDGAKPPRFKYNHRILSLSIFKNLIINACQAKQISASASTKVVGSVVPTSKTQIPYNARKLTISNNNAKRGVMISGSTGSGKTYQVMSFILQDLFNHASVIYYDFKGDKDVVNDISGYAHDAGTDVYIIDEQTANFYLDPFAILTTSGKVEAIMNMRKWDPSGADAHYRTGTQLFLQKTIAAYESELKRGTIKNRSFLFGYRNFLEHMSVPKELFDACTTVKKLLDLCITSGIGIMANDQSKNKPLNLDQDKPFCLICSFSSSSKELATMMCSVLTRTVLAQGTAKPFDNLMFYIDEFGSAENPYIVKDQAEKGRKCGISTIIIVQDINQIIINSNEHYLDSLLGTMNTFLIFPGATKKAAEMLSGVQTNDIQRMLMLLRAPGDGKPGTAIFIAKYSTMKKNSIHEVYHFTPERMKSSAGSNSNNSSNSDNDIDSYESDEISNSGEDNTLMPGYARAQGYAPVYTGNDDSGQSTNDAATTTNATDAAQISPAPKAVNMDFDDLL